MLQDILIGFGLFIGYFIVAGLIPLVLLKKFFKVPSEIIRKMLHIMVAMSIFPLLKFFDTWYTALIAVILMVMFIYPLLALVEKSAWYKRFAVEREGGEFKRSLVVVELAIGTLIFIFWGLLGIEWQYIAVVALMAWGFGDAAAALVGKTYGRRKIQHPRIEGTKTVEGTLAMFVVAGLAIFFTLLIYAGLSWYVSFAVALLAAPICSLVELFSNGGMDTLTVPLSASFVILPLMSLFSFLGV